MSKNREIEPWYRYNAVLYVNEAGQNGLPDAIKNHALAENSRLQNGGDAIWRLRRSVVSHLPRGTVTRIAQIRADFIAARARAKMAA